MVRSSPLVALTAATFAVGLGELAVAGILPSLASDLRVTIPVAGQLVGLYALVFALLTPPLAAAFGGPRRKSGLLVGLLLVAIANAVATIAPTYITLVAARVVAAIGSAIVSPLALSLIDDVVPLERRGRAQGIVFAGFSVAMTIGVPMGALVADHASWRTVFAIVAIGAVLAALLSLGLRLPVSAIAPVPFRWSAARRALSPLVLRLLVISLAIMIAQYATFTYMRPYLAETGDYDLNASAFLLFLLGFFGSIGNVGGGIALDRFGARSAILWCVGANIIVFGAMRFVHGPFPVMVAIFIIWAVSSWAAAPSINHALATASGDQRDVALALNMTACNLGIAGGSALGGIVIATSGVADIVTLGAVFLVAGFAIALPLPRSQPQ
jgi:DHA1 family purine base/nucleoside efflux pump-like MFS transporter